MLTIDWLGCLATAGALWLACRGRWRLPRALVCLALGEVGRALVVLASTGQLVAITAGGAFSGTQPDLPGSISISIAGLWIAALLALPLGRRLRRDTLHYALLGSGAIILLS